MEFPLTIAYNMAERKVGCVLLQTLLGSTFAPGAVSQFFDSKYWELSPDKCKLYTLKSKEEFEKVILITNKK